MDLPFTFFGLPEDPFFQRSQFFNSIDAATTNKETLKSSGPWDGDDYFLASQAIVACIFLSHVCHGIIKQPHLANRNYPNSTASFWLGLAIQTAIFSILASSLSMSLGHRIDAKVAASSLVIATSISVVTFITLFIHSTSTGRGLTHLAFAVVWAIFKFDLSSSLLTLPNCTTFFYACAFAVDLTTPFNSRTFELPLCRLPLFPWLSFSWASSVVAQSSKGRLSDEVLWEIDEQHSVQESLHRLLTALPETGPLLASAVLELVTTCGKLLQPWLLKQFLSNPSLRVVGYMLCARVVTALSSTHGLFLLRMIGVRVKSSIAAMVCERILLTTFDARSDTSSATNLTEVDTNRIVELIATIHMLWAYPLQSIISLACITYLIGWQAVLLSSFVLLFAYPILHIQTNRMHTGMGKLMAAKDKRTGLTEEILSQIKSVYLLSWQKDLTKRLEGTREKELSVVASLASHQSMLMGVLGAVPELMCSVAFLSVYLTSGTLDAKSIFPTLGYWVILKTALPGISAMLPQLFTCLVSFDRIRSFLDAPSALASGTVRDDRLGAILAEGLSFEMAGQGLLSNINLDIRSPSLVTVTGAAGSGKSVLCQGLLGFVSPDKGALTLSGRLAYVPQTPWLVRGSIRDNIVFRRQYKEELYEAVLHACALDVDIDNLEGGDTKPLGGLGASLSGGQMSRISMARALYSQAQVYVFDDPLAALDTKVKAHLVQHVFGRDGMLNDALCVVVTNHPALIRASDTHFTIENGQLCKVTRNIINEAHSTDDSLQDLKIQVEIATPTVVTEDLHCEALCEAIVPLQPNVAQKAAPAIKDLEEVPHLDSAPKRSQCAIYRDWLGKAHPAGWFAVLALIVAGKISSGYSTYLLSVLAADADSAALYDLAWFTAIGLVQSLSSAAFLMVTYHLCLIPAATKMHAALARSVFRKPLLYFVTRSMGSVLNYFTNDMGKLDGTLTGNFLALLMIGSNLVLIVVVLLIPSPIALLYLAPLGLVYFMLQARYLRPACQMRQLELETRVPIIDSIQTAQAGRQSILLYGQRNRFLAEHYSTVNNNVRMMVIANALEGWLLLRLDLIGSLVQVLSALSMMWLRLDPAKLGFVMNYSMQATAMLQALVRFRTNLELDIISVERIESQWDPDVDTKPNAPSEHRTVDGSWPGSGKVSLIEYSAAYPHSAENCLTDISLDIYPGQKVAIVGRTGSGKSSLVLGLLRLLEAKSGHIEIDDVDTRGIDPDELRSRLSVVPQDIPVFEGTLRSNLDPSGGVTDERLRDVIHASRLGAVCKGKGDILDFVIQERGSNLSKGQLQLLAIARALLRNSKIIILDEATSSLDDDAESHFHDFFLTKLDQTTVIAIIHRLERITSYDRVIVLDAGRVVEFGSPSSLVKKEDSVLFGLLRASRHG